MRHFKHRPFAILSALALFFIPATNARAALLLHGIGAIGSSTTDEYQFSPLHSTARNWVETLASTRGWNFGGFTTASRGEPRNQGYEYNWARVGATTSSLLTQGQHTGLASQVASGDVTLAFLWIGTNDFRNVLLAPGQQHLPSTVVPNAVANFTTALDTLLAADPNVRVVVATTYDEGILPYVPQRIQQGLLTQGLADEVGAGIRQYNSQITAIASRDSRVAVTDLYGLFDGIIAADQFSVGGSTLDRKTADAAPDHLFVDTFHPGTIGQALIANAFLDTIDAKFDAGVARLNDQEILTAASVPEPSITVLMGIGGLCSLGYAWRCRKSAGLADVRRGFFGATDVKTRNTSVLSDAFGTAGELSVPHVELPRSPPAQFVFVGAGPTRSVRVVSNARRDATSAMMTQNTTP